MRGQLKGLCFVLATASIWVTASFIEQALVVSKTTGPPTLPPLLLTWICTSLFSCYIPLLLVKHGVKCLMHKMTSVGRERYASDQGEACQKHMTDSTVQGHLRLCSEPNDVIEPLLQAVAPAQTRLTILKTAAMVSTAYSA
jgi:hypothetical protein